MIRIEIGEMVLHGFEYHDHRRIGASIELELSRLVKEKGVFQDRAEGKKISKVDNLSFDIDTYTSSRSIGTGVANSVFRSWNRNSNLLKPSK